MRTDVNITIDLDELIEGLRNSEAKKFIEENLGYASDQAIIDYLEDRGYEVTKEV